MKMIRIDSPGGLDVLQYVDAPKPVAGPGDVLVRAQAIGVGKPDLLIRQGSYRWMPPLPATPGNELAGIVEALGDGVSGLRVGQSVLVSSRELPQRGGCYAEFIRVPAASVYPLPETITSEDAVSLPNYQLAGALLHEATAGWRPKSVLVHGAAGGVATAIIQLAAVEGIAVIGTASTDEKCRFALASGARDVIQYRRDGIAERERDNLADRVRELTGGHGVDLVLDHVAGPRFTDNLDLLAPLGLLVSYNALAGLPEKDLFAEMRRLVGRSLAVRCFSIHTLDAMPEVRRRLMQHAIDLLAAGRIRPPAPVVLPLSQARRAHEMLERAETLGKVVLRPD